MRVVECRGVPRDQGFEQGRVLRAELRGRHGGAGLSSWLRGWRRDPGRARLERDLRRYFPHQAEWLEGISLGSGVPLRGLIEALGSRWGAELHRAPVAGALSGEALRLVRPVPLGAVLRRAEPEGRFASVEVGWPDSSIPLVGVNEAGLAVSVAGIRSAPGRYAPPAALFARDCLERYEKVEAALEWCLARPCAEGGVLLFADASGELAGVDTAGPRRRVLRPVDGWLAWGLPRAGLPTKSTSAGSAELEAALLSALAVAGPEPVPPAWVDPRLARLGVGGERWSAR